METQKVLRRSMVALTMLLVMLPLASHAGTGCGAGQLVPQLNEFMVNQGLPYDKAGAPFVRGKDALARLFLSMPQCATASDSIQVTGATLTVSNGTLSLGSGALFSPTRPTQILQYYTGAPPTADNAGDPLFTIPGSILTPCGGAAGCTDNAFTATFNATIRFAANGASSSASFNRTADFAQKTNALRLLVIPMGDTGQTYRSQYSTLAEATTRQSLTVLGRIFPVPNGVGELCPPPSPGSLDPGCGPSDAGGLRYHLDLAAMVNLKDPTLGSNTYIGMPPAFCGTGGNFDGIKRQLTAYLESWNTLHPNNEADVVLGVVDSAIASTANSCADGMGAINDKEAWSKIIPDQPGAPSRSGATIAMEIAHTFGVVPCCNRSQTYHSANIQATNSSTLNRAYNVDQRRYIANNHSVMNYTNTTGPWNADTTFLEHLDQADSLCLLGGPSEGQDCTTPSPTFAVGTSQNVNAGATFVVSGTTDGTANGTKVNESYVTQNEPLTQEDPASSYRLVENGTAGHLVKGFDVHFPSSVHLSPDETDPHLQSNAGVFELALADGVSSTSFALYFCGANSPAACMSDPANNQGALLYGAANQAVTPAVVSTRPLGAGAGANLTRGAVVDHNHNPTFSPDGGWVGYARSHTGNNTYTDSYMFVNGFMKTVGTTSGNELDHCLIPQTSGFSPFAMTTGFYYSEMDFTGYSPTGDGKIHHMTSNCKDTGSIPVGTVADGLPSDVGALAVDTRDNTFWTATYNDTTFNNQTGQFFFHLRSDGSMISACNVPSDAVPGTGNDTLMLANIPSLGGSGWYLLTDAGEIGTAKDKLYAVDTASCVGSSLVLPTATYTSPIGIGGSWYDQGMGKFWTTDRTNLYNVALPSGATGALTVVSTTSLANTPASGLVVNPFRSELHVAPIGDVNGGGIISSEQPLGRPSFCNNGNLIYSTADGDIYGTAPGLTTTPPTFSTPWFVFDASETTPTPNAITCLADDRIVIGADDNNIYIVNSDGSNLKKISLSANECGQQPSASPIAADNRIAFYSFPCSGGGTYGIRILNIDTGIESWVTQRSNLSGQLGNPVIGTDGRVGFQIDTEVHTVRADGSDDRLITGSANAQVISMHDSLVSYSDGQDIYISNTSQAGSRFDVRGALPDEMRADVVYQCANGVTEPVSVGQKPSSTTSTDAIFESTFDSSSACGGGGGTLIFYASDGFTRVSSTQSQNIPETATSKTPVAALTSPPDGQTYSTDGVIPLSGGGSDAQDGETSTMSWSFDGTSIGSGGHVDAQPPRGGWSPGSHTIALKVTNSAGLSDTTSRTITIVDDIPPMVSVSHTVDGQHGWNVSSPVNVAITASDDGSGLSSIGCLLDGNSVNPTPNITAGSSTYSGTISVTGDGPHSVSCKPTDVAGNVGSASNDALKIDTTIPSVSITSPDPSYTYQLNETANASYSCSDENLTSCEGPLANGSPINTSQTGTFSFAVTGTDDAGNSKTASVSYTVVNDTTPPTLTITHTPNGAHGWNRTSPVNVGVTTSDSELGVFTVACTVDGRSVNPGPSPTPNAHSYSGTLTVSGDGTHNVSCSSSDRAGNTARASDTVMIDSVTPSTSVKSPIVNATYLSGERILASYSCSDALSGVASCVGDVSNGSSIDTSSAGSKVFRVAATDIAGNIQNTAVPYTVNPACSSLTGLDADYSTHPIASFGGVKITLNAPKAEATLHLHAPSCDGVSYVFHVMNSSGTTELRSQTVTPSPSTSNISFSVDMGNGALGQFLDPSTVCVWGESLAPSTAQYYRIPQTGCLQLTEDGPSKHV